MDFQKTDLTFSPTSPAIPYRRRKCEDKSRNKWGQLKLLMTEVQFFTLFWNPQEVSNPIVVYAGAAPGIHIPYLAELFPAFQFYLYDPAKFDIQPTDRIHIFNEPFTNKTARQWSGRQDVFFLSDIRTVGWDMEGMTETDVETGVWNDMCLQQEWYDLIRPVKAHMKFRLPYIHEDTTITNTEYLNGYVFIQPWTGPTSTETRLVPLNHNRIQWDSLRYEQQAFFHNTITRSIYKYKNPFTNQVNPIYSDQLLNDYDSRLTAQIVIDYLTKFDTPSYTRFKEWIDDAIQALDPHDSGRTIASIRQEAIHVPIADSTLIQTSYSSFVKSNLIVDVLKSKAIPHWDILYDILVYPDRYIETLQRYLVLYPNLPLENLLKILSTPMDYSNKSTGMILTDGKTSATIQYRNNRTQVPIWGICEMKDHNIPKASQLAVYYRYLAFMSDFWKWTIPVNVKRLLDNYGVDAEFLASPFQKVYSKAWGYYAEDQQLGLQYQMPPVLTSGNYLVYLHNSVYLQEWIESLKKNLSDIPNLILYIIGPQSLDFGTYEQMRLDLQPGKYTMWNAYRQEPVRPTIASSFLIVANQDVDFNKELYSQTFYS